jgi:beta-glucosidase
VLGAYAWSLIDGFEFNLGLGIRVGLYYVDKDLARHPRKSAFWFAEMLAQNATALS